MRSRRSIEAQRNLKPQPECLLQNQFLILETNLDIRDLLIKITKTPIPVNIISDEPQKEADTKTGEVL